MHEKLKVDPEDEVMDAYSYYKCADFEPWIPKCVYKKVQPAIDNGGVFLQVFSNVFHALANNEVIKSIFVGNERGCQFSAINLLLMGFFRLLERWLPIAWCNSPGFPCLASTFYCIMCRCW